MPYRRLKLVMWAALVAYLAIGLNLGFNHQHQEIFPFFSWSLFSKVKTQRIDFGVMLERVNGEDLVPPIDLMSARGVVPGAGSIRAYWALQKLGPALQSRNPQRYEPLRQTFEASYLSGPSQLSYAVVVRRWDPIANYRSSVGRCASWRAYGLATQRQRTERSAISAESQFQGKAPSAQSSSALAAVASSELPSTIS